MGAVALLLVYIPAEREWIPNIVDWLIINYVLSRPGGAEKYGVCASTEVYIRVFSSIDRLRQIER